MGSIELNTNAINDHWTVYEERGNNLDAVSKQYQRELHNASITYKIPMNVLAQYAEASTPEERKKFFTASTYNVPSETYKHLCDLYDTMCRTLANTMGWAQDLYPRVKFNSNMRAS